MANRVLIGDRSGTYGMFVSRAGYNVENCADAYLTFDSRAKGMMIIAKGSITIPSASSSGTVSFSGMTVPPIIEAYRSEYVSYFGQIMRLNTLGDWTVTVTSNSLTFTRGSTTGEAIFGYVIYGVGV